MSMQAVPSEFYNVTVTAKANVYFAGKVVSHTVVLLDGEKKTLGLIYPGEFHFGTDAPELMQIVAGQCRVRLDGSEEWNSYGEGASFRIPRKSGFDIAVDSLDGGSNITEYICSFE